MLRLKKIGKVTTAGQAEGQRVVLAAWVHGGKWGLLECRLSCCRHGEVGFALRLSSAGLRSLVTAGEADGIVLMSGSPCKLRLDHLCTGEFALVYTKDEQERFHLAFSRQQALGLKRWLEEAAAETGRQTAQVEGEEVWR